MYSQGISIYIENAQPFAQPILNHFRELVHVVCPEVEEKLKWSMPFFDYKGSSMCHMAAFKKHCVIGFWKAQLMQDAALFYANNENAMSHMGRISSLADLPHDDILIGYIAEAMDLNERGIKLPVKPKPDAKAPIEIPIDFLQLLQTEPNAILIFESWTYSKRKEYILWINDAKTQGTRERRMQKAFEQILEGKSLNWQYFQK